MYESDVVAQRSRARAAASRAPSGSAGTAGRVRCTPVAVLADAPVIAVGLGRLISRTPALDVVATTTHLDVAAHLVRADAARVVVLSASSGSDGTDWALACLDEIHAVARAADREVGTVCVCSAVPSATARVLRTRCSAVHFTEDGAGGLARSIHEARERRPPRLGNELVVMAGSDAPAAADTRSSLTARELDVLRGLVNGLSSKRIAQELDLSVNTVRTHVQRVLPKLGVHTRLRAVAVALEEGIVEQRQSSALFAAH